MSMPSRAYWHTFVACWRPLLLCKCRYLSARLCHSHILSSCLEYWRPSLTCIYQSLKCGTIHHLHVNIYHLYDWFHFLHIDRHPLHAGANIFPNISYTLISIVHRGLLLVSQEPCPVATHSTTDRRLMREIFVTLQLNEWKHSTSTYWLQSDGLFSSHCIWPALTFSILPRTFLPPRCCLGLGGRRQLEG